MANPRKKQVRIALKLKKVVFYLPFLSPQVKHESYAGEARPSPNPTQVKKAYYNES